MNHKQSRMKNEKHLQLVSILYIRKELKFFIFKDKIEKKEVNNTIFKKWGINIQFTEKGMQIV